jgi:hypothetical protein
MASKNMGTIQLTSFLWFDLKIVLQAKKQTPTRNNVWKKVEANVENFFPNIISCGCLFFCL